MRAEPPLPRLFLSHFRTRSTTSKLIGPSLGVSLDNAPFVCALRSLATAAAASRLMTRSRLDWGAARPLQTLPPDLHLPAALLAPLHPLQLDCSQPGAAASLPGRLFVGSCGALGQRSPARGRSLHAPPLVSQFGLLAAPVFLLRRTIHAVSQWLQGGGILHHGLLPLGWPTLFPFLQRYWPLRL